MLGLKRLIWSLVLMMLLSTLTGCRVIALPFQWPMAQPVEEEASSEASAADLTDASTEVLSPEAATPPVTFAIPDLALELPIEPMGWVVTEQEGQRTTSWIVPTDAIGWHVNSVGAGGAGNLILSGHQVLGSAVFAPLALGDITVGQEIVLTDSNGLRFHYRVTEISEPIPVLGASDDDSALARSYLQPSETAILTMMTGWPDFTTTHRIFAVAEYMPGSSE